MNKKILAVLLSVIPLLIASCLYIGPSEKGNGNVTEETREVGPFTGIKVSRGMNVYICQGSPAKVVVKADENLMDLIETRVEDGILKITITGAIRKASEKKVLVTVEEIESISTTSGSNVFSDSVITSPSLKISASAGSNLNLAINSEEVEFSAFAGSNINLEGKAGEFEGNASAGSNVRAGGLATKISRVKASSGANIWIQVDEKLDGKASSGGNVFYSGNPQNTEIHSSSGGNVKKN